MANPFYVAPLGGLQGVRQIQQGMQAIGSVAEQGRAEQARAQAQQAVAEAFQSGDVNAIRQAMIQYPEMAEQAKSAFGFTNEQTERVARETYRRVLSDPENAPAYMQQGIQQVAEFGGRPEMMTRDLQMLQQNPEAALKGIRAGYAALASEPEFKAMFGSDQKPTAFMQEMIAAGIEPGSREYKDAVLERYGKGQTIGFDVVEAVNPDTGRNEYFQVSRTDPGNRIALGIEVPQDPQVQAKIAAAREAEVEAAQKESDTITGTLGTIDKILKSDGLSGFSGLDSFRRMVPGTEAANVAAYIEQLQSQNFLTAVEQMKGMGALSENEGKKLSSAVAALSPSMSDEAVKRELESIRAQLSGALEKINSGSLSRDAGQDSGVVDWRDL